jgi:hypothetical protein
MSTLLNGVKVHTTMIYDIRFLISLPVDIDIDVSIDYLDPELKSINLYTKQLCLPTFETTDISRVINEVIVHDIKYILIQLSNSAIDIILSKCIYSAVPNYITIQIESCVYIFVRPTKDYMSMSIDPTCLVHIKPIGPLPKVLQDLYDELEMLHKYKCYDWYDKIYAADCGKLRYFRQQPYSFPKDILLHEKSYVTLRHPEFTLHVSERVSANINLHTFSSYHITWNVYKFLKNLKKIPYTPNFKSIVSKCKFKFARITGFGISLQYVDRSYICNDESERSMNEFFSLYYLFFEENDLIAIPKEYKLPYSSSEIIIQYEKLCLPKSESLLDCTDTFLIKM